MTPPPPLPGRRPGRGGGEKKPAPGSICDGCAAEQAARGCRWRRSPKAAGPWRRPQARKCVAGVEGAGGASRAVGPRGPKVLLFAQEFEYYGSCWDRSSSLRDPWKWKPQGIWRPRDIWQDIGKPRDIWEPRYMYKSQQNHPNPRDVSARFLRYFGRLRDRSPFQGGPMGFGGLFPPAKFSPHRRG